MGDFNTIVVGGGVVGAAIAYGACKAGDKVVVLDEGDSALRASRGNGGLVWVQHKGLGRPAYTQLSLNSAMQWETLHNDLLHDSGIDVLFEQKGGVECCLSEEELEQRAAEVKAMMAENAEIDLNIEIIGSNAVREMLPGIGPDVIGASYCQHDGAANPQRFLWALHAAIQNLGSIYSPGDPVTSIESMSEGYCVRRGADSFTAEKVVLAAGLGNVPLAALLGVDLPIRAQKGQAIVTSRMDGQQKVFLAKARQTTDGHFILGSSVEEGASDLDTHFEYYGGSIRRSIRILPALSQAKLLRVWASQRVMTSDSYPVYDQLQSHPGVFVAACHSGITLGAVHALSVGPAIAKGQLPTSLDTFNLDRFQETA